MAAVSNVGAFIILDRRRLACDRAVILRSRYVSRSRSVFSMVGATSRKKRFALVRSKFPTIKEDVIP
jgi:hypothetical protein